jgi:hypothetical protein
MTLERGIEGKEIYKRVGKTRFVKKGRKQHKVNSVRVEIFRFDPHELCRVAHRANGPLLPMLARGLR